MRGRYVPVCLLALSCSSTVITSSGKGSGGSRSGTGGQSIQLGGGTSGAYTGAGGISNVCAGQFFDSNPPFFDLYLMFDQSSSMGDPLPGSNPPTTWWQAAQTAVTKFVTEPRADGTRPGYAPISVGIQFFPLNGIAPQSCMADYQTPEVELAELPGNAPAVAAAIQKHQPTSLTPTSAALSGAITVPAHAGSCHAVSSRRSGAAWSAPSGGESPPLACRGITV